MICKAAEIESPTLYYFFKSKKGLFLSIRNDLVNEYRRKVVELFLDKDDNSAKSLKNYYLFCIEYAKNNPDAMRFYLRYRLFKPKELREEIEAYIEESTEEKRRIYRKFLDACDITENTNYFIEDAFQKYIHFIDNNTFHIIFSNWQPTNAEVEKAWDLFYTNYLMTQKEREITYIH